MSHVRGEITIKRAVEEVFDFVADQRNEPRYNDAMLESEKLTEGPVGAGTSFRAIVGNSGRPVEMLIEFVEFDRPRFIRETTHMAAMDIRGTLTFQPALEGTRMRWSWELVPHGVYRLMGPVLAQLGSRQEARIWASLKDYLEQPGLTTAASPDAVVSSENAR